MRPLLCITAASGPRPDFGFLAAHGYAVTHLPDTTADLGKRLADHAIVIAACETRGTQHARFWWMERELFAFVRGGGRLLFTAPCYGAWSQVWSAFPALVPVTPLMRSACAENFSDRFRWDRGWERPLRSPLVPEPGHPVCAGLRDWPEAYQGAKPGSYNAYDYDRWTPKPHTDVALRTLDGDVALAFMPFGAGRTAFLLADLHDDGGASWASWADSERFWAALLRHLDTKPLRLELAPAAGPALGDSAAWVRALTRGDWTMLADNQLALNVSATPYTREPAAYSDGWFRPVDEEPGIGHAKFYPPATQFDCALSADPVVGGRVVPLAVVPGSRIWRPHLLTQRFRSADGALELEKRTAIADDVVCAELRLVHGDVDAWRLRGWNRHHGFLEGDASGRLLGQVENGICFGVATGGRPHWTLLREAPLRYEAELPAPREGVLTLLFTVAMERATVAARLDAARAAPASVFDSAFHLWDDYFRREVPAFRSEDPEIERLVYGAFLGFRINLYDIPYEPWRDPHSCPSKMHFDPHWEQDDVQAATIGKWLRDPRAIEGQLLGPFRLRLMLNKNAVHGPLDREPQGLVSELQQYSIPLRELYLFDPRPELRRELIAMLLREEAKNEEVTPVDPATGLFCTFNCLGMDDSPRWDLVSPGQKAEWFQTFERGMVTPDVNATIAHRAAFLAELLEAEGDVVRAAEFRARAERRKRLIREHTWSEAAGFFVDRVGGESGCSDVLTPMGFAPLLLGPYDDAVARGVERALEDENTFRTPYVLPTVARSHPKFDANSYWRGAIWPRTNWFAAEALQAAGLREAAATLTRRWLELALKDGADLRENYNPLTGAKKCAHMFTEGLAGIADLYLKNVVGFRPTLSGFDLDPISLTPDTPSFAFGPLRYRGHDVTITWDRSAGRGELLLDRLAQAWTPGARLSIAVPSPAHDPAPTA